MLLLQNGTITKENIHLSIIDKKVFHIFCSNWHINTFYVVYTFIYTLCICWVCAGSVGLSRPGNFPEMLPLAYPDCYLYGYCHAADTKIDTQSICTWQIISQATVHHDNIDRWTTCTISYGIFSHVLMCLRILFLVLRLLLFLMFTCRGGPIYNFSWKLL